MTSRSGSGVVGRDLAWKYCTPVDGNRNNVTCNYCGMIIKNEDITWFKFQLSHTNSNSNTKKCL